MSIVKLKLLNHAMLQFIECEPGIAQELSDRLTFEVPGAKYMPAVRKKGGWDGHIRLFNRKNGQINAGLYDNIRSYIESSGHTIELEETEFGVPGSKNGVQRKEVVDWINTLTLPWEPYYYQIDAVTHALRHKRAVFVCPTGSGKSYIAYLASRAYLARHQSHILIIVPTTSLVEQLSSDFIEYNASMSDYVQKIYQGHEIEIKKPIVISTWQSIYKLPKEWFAKFGMIIGDECHGFKSKSLTSIMNKSVNAEYRIGLTGTLDDSEVHALVLEGLFGPILQVTTTAKLQAEKVLAPLKIQMLALQYTNEERKSVHKVAYHDEVDFLVAHERRNKLITNLALDLDGNTLILFNYVEKHGKVLHDILDQKIEKGRKLYFVAGETDVKIREAIRGIVEKQSNAIIVASFGTFSTGINIRNIHNIIFASPSKSVIRVLQSIGRGLRISDNGYTTNLYDIMDELKWSGRENFSMKHGNARITIYEREDFVFKIIGMKI